MSKGTLKIISLFVVIAAIIIAVILVEKAEAPTKEAPVSSQAKNMELKSSAFENNANIPEKFTCDGANINPPLEIFGVPEGAKSLTLILHDPDAPKASGWTHWTIFNIAPDTSGIAENSSPAGAVEGMTDFGKPGYGGPCPPSGTHHYQFKLYALDTTLTLDSSAKKEDIEKAMDGHILEETIFIGLYQRKS
jgi:Raf kinase inhibitor-like YbhB/YbcL family protein